MGSQGCELMSVKKKTQTEAMEEAQKPLDWLAGDIHDFYDFTYKFEPENIEPIDRSPAYLTLMRTYRELRLRVDFSGRSRLYFFASYRLFRYFYANGIWEIMCRLEGFTAEDVLREQDYYGAFCASSKIAIDGLDSEELAAVCAIGSFLLLQSAHLIFQKRYTGIDQIDRSHGLHIASSFVAQATEFLLLAEHFLGESGAQHKAKEILTRHAATRGRERANARWAPRNRVKDRLFVEYERRRNEFRDRKKFARAMVDSVKSWAEEYDDIDFPPNNEKALEKIYDWLRKSDRK